MQTAQPSLIARDDTFLGICEGLGEDFGFNPLYLRIALGVSLIASPVAAVAAYLGLGVVVAATRLLVPNPRLAVAADVDRPEGTDAGQSRGEPAPSEENDNREALPVAA